MDFCSDPSAICRGHSDDNIKNAEVRWIMGMLYWENTVQAYNKDGWSYMDELHTFVDGGMADADIFGAISRIVTRGCHDTCGNAISNAERRDKFDKLISIFTKAQNGPVIETVAPTTAPKQTPFPSKSPTSRPTLRPTAKDTMSPVTNAPISLAPTTLFRLSPEELSSRLNVPNSYCATSIDDARTNCATATMLTCNEGDPPCVIGTACFGNVLCYPDVNDAQMDSEESPNPAASLVLNTVTCGENCLRPLNFNECQGATHTVSSFPKCLGIAIGEVCESQGECGPKALIGNCDGDRSVFIRVFVEQCSSTADAQVETIKAAKPTMYPSISPEPSPVADVGVVATSSSSPVKPNRENDEYSIGLNAWWKDVPLGKNGSLRLSVCSLLSLSYLSMTIVFIIQS